MSRSADPSTAPPLVCRVERTLPFALVRVAGLLDMTTAPRLRSALLKVLAEQPAALLLDLSGLVVGDALALVLFGTAARRAARWPGAAVLVVVPDQRLRSLLINGPAGRYLDIHADEEMALAAAAAHPIPPRFEFDLPRSVHAPALARSHAQRACHAWGIPQAATAAEIVLGELVGNAVQHATGPIGMTLQLRGRYLHLSVADGDRRRPRRRTIAAEYDDGGRGLLLVDAVATAWGSVSTAAGKRVWATVRARPDGDAGQ
jgi:anti-anti-sigma regulatory factor/anti-sigma regulatory factor (Ser/Thr protein kinase)